MNTRGNLFTVRQVREACTAHNADLKPDGTILFGVEPPFFFMGIVADDNECLVTENCLYYVNGEAHRLLDVLPHDPENRHAVIF